MKILGPNGWLTFYFFYPLPQLSLWPVRPLPQASLGYSRSGWADSQSLGGQDWILLHRHHQQKSLGGRDPSERLLQIFILFLSRYHWYFSRKKPLCHCTPMWVVGKRLMARHVWPTIETFFLVAVNLVFTEKDYGVFLPIGFLAHNTPTAFGGGICLDNTSFTNYCHVLSCKKASSTWSFHLTMTDFVSSSNQPVVWQYWQGWVQTISHAQKA